MAATPAAPVAPALQDADMQADIAEVRERVARIEGQLPHLATKADLQKQGAEVKEQVAQIEGQHPHLATKADLADATTRLERAVRRQTYWLVGTLIAVGGLIFAGLKLL